MGVKWINKTEAEGTAIMYPNYLLTNREFVSKFEGKYSALVGLDDDTDQIVLKPLSYDDLMNKIKNGDYELSDDIINIGKKKGKKS